MYESKKVWLKYRYLKTKKALKSEKRQNITKILHLYYIYITFFLFY